MFLEQNTMSPVGVMIDSKPTFSTGKFTTSSKNNKFTCNLINIFQTPHTLSAKSSLAETQRSDERVKWERNPQTYPT